MTTLETTQVKFSKYNFSYIKSHHLSIEVEDVDSDGEELNLIDFRLELMDYSQGSDDNKFGIVFDWCLELSNQQKEHYFKTIVKMLKENTLRIPYNVFWGTTRMSNDWKMNSEENEGVYFNENDEFLLLDEE
jgi:hypothetical protein